jgi:hypothetical protein
VINDPLNSTSEVVKDKNIPTFIEAMSQNHNDGIVQIPAQHQG